MAEGFDVIGDIHGYADQLTGLLNKMGYRDGGQGFAHPTRRAAFVGDLVDRGPKQNETIRIVRRMVAAGNAQMVLGNHEINTIRYRLRDPNAADGFVRSHSEKNRAIHGAFLSQLVEGSQEYSEAIDWFLEQPLWLDLGGLRVVHACWDTPSIDHLKPLVGANESVTEEILRSPSGSATDMALSVLTRGPEVSVTEPYLFASGNRSDKARYRWWDTEATTLDRAVLIPDRATALDGSPYPQLPSTALEAPIAPYNDGIPVLFGHYWFKGQPAILAPQIACLDFSVARGGPLMAYRWQGESQLSNDGFVSFSAQQEEKS